MSQPLTFYNGDARTITIAGVIDDQTTVTVLQAWLTMRSSADPVTVYLHTTGGCLHCSLAVYDVLRCFQCPVDIVVVGKAWSGGALLLQAGTRRLMMPNSSVMIHHGSVSDLGRQNIEEYLCDARETEKIREQFWTIVARRMGKKIGVFLREHPVDRYYTPREAIAAKLADEIVGGIL